jgi:putative SOS response-associated peptidase YedK
VRCFIVQILVGDASHWMTTYHDRMPVLLAPEHFYAWLDGSMGLDDLKLSGKETLRGWPVSKRVNRSGEGDDDPTILEPVTMTASSAV